MKRLAQILFLQFCILTITLNFAAFGQTAEMKLSPEQQKIWGLVESFWETAQNGDLEGLMNLLHEKYIYWPKGYTVTFNKSEIEEILTFSIPHGFIFSKFERFNCTLFSPTDNNPKSFSKTSCPFILNIFLLSKVL